VRSDPKHQSLSLPERSGAHRSTFEARRRSLRFVAKEARVGEKQTYQRDRTASADTGQSGEGVGLRDLLANVSEDRLERLRRTT